jgi:hypothetical protein
MNDTTKNTAGTDSPIWLSTYGILTAERILERFKINLSRKELLETLKNPDSVYHHLLTVPLKNIFNGIVIKQVYDYQVYAQKLFIDYKLASTAPAEDSEEATPAPDSDIDIKCKELMQLNELFDKKQHIHQQLIAKSQAWLIKQTRETMLEVNTETSSKIEGFSADVESLLITFQDLREQLRELIIQTTAILSVTSDYKIDPEQMAENKESLDFDPEMTTEVTY